MDDYWRSDFQELTEEEYRAILKPLTFREGVAVADLVDELWEAGEHFRCPDGEHPQRWIIEQAKERLGITAGTPRARLRQ